VSSGLGRWPGGPPGGNRCRRVAAASSSSYRLTASDERRFLLTSVMLELFVILRALLERLQELSPR
jgi:hypothetical protein